MNKPDICPEWAECEIVFKSGCVVYYSTDKWLHWDSELKRVDEGVWNGPDDLEAYLGRRIVKKSLITPISFSLENE